MMTLSNKKKRRIRDWKSGILSSEKKLIEHLPVIGIWFWKLRVKSELDKLYKEDQEKLTVWTTMEQAMKFTKENIEPMFKDEKEPK